MRTIVQRTSIVSALLVAIAIFAAGCGPSEKSTGPAPKKSSEAGKKTTEHQHGEWWCVEHGIPEHECSMCSADYAAKCKAKGDWCEKHDRAKSQCFLCEPALKEKYAAKYRAKFGKEPPPIEEPEGKE